jgi:polyhydroxybutyrate depolymerase
VFEAMRLWREVNRCDDYRADAFETGEGEPPRWVRTWEECAPGTALELALFDGGHAVPGGWTDATLDWFEALEGERR